MIQVVSGLDIGNFRNLQKVNKITVNERPVPSEEDIGARLRDRLAVKIEQDIRHLSPQERVWKVDRFLSAVEAMGVEAANRILKMLEEPGPETVFVLTTSRLHQVLPTIRSRCQRIAFGEVPAEDVRKVLADDFGVSENDIRNLQYGATLHDIGKIGISGKILNKNGRLTEAEYEVIKKHPVIGERIIERVDFLQGARPIVRGHHERFDGTGYPDGLRDEEIPFLARISCVVDFFDALTSDRPYRRAYSAEQALEQLEPCRLSARSKDASTDSPGRAARSAKKSTSAATPCRSAIRCCHRQSS